jgi:hypothetical protein
VASFVWMLLAEPTYNRTRLALAWRARILSQKTLRNVSRLSPGFVPSPLRKGAISWGVIRSACARSGRSRRARLAAKALPSKWATPEDRDLAPILN